MILPGRSAREIGTVAITAGRAERGFIADAPVREMACKHCDVIGTPRLYTRAAM